MNRLGALRIANGKCALDSTQIHRLKQEATKIGWDDLKELVDFMLEHFGHGASAKFVPGWIKNLPEKYLEMLIKAMCEGDGHRRKDILIPSWLYSSTSEQMIDDLQEIAF